ncbi:MAG: type II toxin-antitoxin system VapC family toxin [Chthoniobacterales bacterium]|nr:type II toxin-antitoxin system VapC family toxin [Chthoniobacterales bacterium]
MKSVAVRAWLLDTHALLWALYADRRLSPAAKRHIDGELPVYYATVSFWEIALKRGGKGFDFEIEDDWDIVIPRALEEAGIIRLDLEARDCRRMEDLPLHHRDPFDRMLAAQALRRRFGIVSRDTCFDGYGVVRGW